MNEAIVVDNGQAAVATTSVSGELSPKSSPTDIITVVKTADGDQAAVKVFNLGGGGGGGASGDYLPLSGGTLTGPLGFDITGNNYSYIPIIVNSDGESIMSAQTGGSGQITGAAMSFKNVSVGSTIYASYIGTALSPVQKMYIKQIGSGKDGSSLNVPDGTGTIARIEDINAAVGNISTALTAILGE